MRHAVLHKLTVLGIALLLIAGMGDSRPTWGQAATQLFNGWSISPAGKIIPLEHLEAVVPISGPFPTNMTADLPLKMIVSPNGKVLLAACAGYNATGLAVVDLATNKLVQFLPEPEVWNGLAFSRDGKKVYLSGGDSGKVYAFDYKAGKLSLGTPVAPAAKVETAAAGKDAGPVARSRRKSVQPESPTAKTTSFWRASRSIQPRVLFMWPTRPTMRFGSSIPKRWRGKSRIAHRAASAQLRIRRRRRASLRFQLGQPQREHHRHARPAAKCATWRSASGPTTWSLAPRWPALRRLLRRQHGARDSHADG